MKVFNKKGFAALAAVAILAAACGGSTGGKTLTIGISLPLSGSALASAGPAQNGAELAISEVCEEMMQRRREYSKGAHLCLLLRSWANSFRCDLGTRRHTRRKAAGGCHINPAQLASSSRGCACDMLHCA